MIDLQLILGMLFFAIGMFTPFSWGVTAVGPLFLLGAFFAATNDIAIDGFYLVALDAAGQAKYVGYRVMAYRIAMMTGTGLIATIGTRIGWFPGFATAGALMILLSVHHLLHLPRCETESLPLIDALSSFSNLRLFAGTLLAAAVVTALYSTTRSEWYRALQKTVPPLSGIGFAGWISMLLLLSLVVIGIFRTRIAALFSSNPESFYSRAFMSFMDREHIGLFITFIIFLRTGEFLLSAMAAPFIVDLGLEVHYGWMQAAIGLPASIAGAMLGGYLISRMSLTRVLFPFLLLQNGSNLVYMILAFSLQKYIEVNGGGGAPVPVGPVNLALVAAVQGFDQFSGGLGTAVLMTFLMRICIGESKAAHYAIGSGLMNISGLFTGIASGFIASRTGYGWFFGISFLLSIPGMALAFPVMSRFPSRRGE